MKQVWEVNRTKPSLIVQLSQQINEYNWIKREYEVLKKLIVIATGCHLYFQNTLLFYSTFLKFFVLLILGFLLYNHKFKDLLDHLNDQGNF